jgi:hypothetical protein
VKDVSCIMASNKPPGEISPHRSGTSRLLKS